MSPASCTSSRGSIIRADAGSPTTRNVRRGTRSTTYPNTGASRAGAVIHEERQARGAVGAGQRLDPHAEHDQHQRVAEHAGGQAGEQPPEARRAERLPHHGATVPVAAADRPGPASPPSRRAGRPSGRRVGMGGPLGRPLEVRGRARPVSCSRSAVASSAVSHAIDESSPVTSRHAAGSDSRDARAARSRCTSRSTSRSLSASAAIPRRRGPPRRAHPSRDPGRPRATAGCDPSRRGLADEAVLGQLAQVPRAVGRRLAQQGRRLARGHRPLGDHGLEQREPERVGQHLEVRGVGDAASNDRHVLKVLLSKGILQ